MADLKHRNALQPGYRLHWYHIEKILGQGGFGITYLARDTNLDQWVAIKEYLPVELAVREDNVSIHPVSEEFGDQYEWGLERFISEAQTLARFKHPNIVRVLTVFRENNSAYMIMEFEQGRGLDEILKEKKTLDEESVKNIILPILDGLDAVHQSDFIHRDIKPPNIYIRTNNTPVLLDFGSARQSLSERTRTLTTLVSPGYAPFEQYVSNSKKQGPWTDIYGLGATLYRSVTGVSPPDSMDRSEAILHTGRDIFVSAGEIAHGKYSESILTAIDHAMAFKPEDRPQSITEWRKELFGEPMKVSAEIPVPSSSVIAEPVTQSEVTTKLTDPVTENDHKTIKVVETQAPAVETFADTAYRYTIKMVKWASVLLLVLVVLAVVGKYRKAGQETMPEPAPPEVSAVPEPEMPPEDTASGETGAVSEMVVQDNSQFIEQLLKNAEADIRALRLTSPAGNNALDKYREVLRMDPGNAAARNGIDNIVTEYISLMDNAIAENSVEKAGTYLNRAIRINPDHAGIDPARQRLSDAKLAAERTQTVTKSRVPDSVRNEMLSLKERLGKNPDDVQARRQLRTFAQKYEINIREAMDNGDYELAREYVYTLQSITEENSSARRRLDELLKVIENKSRTGSR